MDAITSDSSYFVIYTEIPSEVSTIAIHVHVHTVHVQAVQP